MAREQIADTESCQLTKDQEAKYKLEMLTRDLKAARKKVADLEDSQLTEDREAKAKLEALTRALKAARKQCSELQDARLREQGRFREYLDTLEEDLDDIRERCSEHMKTITRLGQDLGVASQQITTLTAELEAAKTHSRNVDTQTAGIQRAQQDLDVASQQITTLTAELGAAKTHSRNVDTQIADIRRAQQDLGVAKRRITTLTTELTAAKRHSHDVDAQATDLQITQQKVTGLKQDLDVANERISTLTAELTTAKKHSHDVDAQAANLQNAEQKVIGLKQDLDTANDRISTLTVELTAAKEHSKEHSHNVNASGSARVRELEGDITALNQHLNRVLDDNTELLDGIHKIKREDEFARRDVVRLKTQVAELEKESKEKNISIDRMVQLLLRQTETPTPPESSNPVGSKRSSPTSNDVNPPQKRVKPGDSAITDAIDLTLDGTERSNAKVNGLVPNADDETKFTLLPQSDLPQVVQDKVNEWILKLDAHGVKNGVFTWMKAGHRDTKTCAARKYQKASSHWRDNDRACMDCSTKGHPCIVIRTTGPVLLPLYRPQGQPSDPGYWILQK